MLGGGGGQGGGGSGSQGQGRGIHRDYEISGNSTRPRVREINAMHLSRV